MVSDSRFAGVLPSPSAGTDQVDGARRYGVDVLTQACGHVASASPVRVCPHLVAVAEDRSPALVGLLTGQALAYDLACTECAKAG